MPRSLMFPVIFDALPVEIICHILDNLDMHDLLTCSTVSKHLKRVVEKSSELQYIIELERARMVNLLPPSAALPYASRLKLLRQRERNWKNMTWAKRHTLTIPPTGSVYEFVGGLYGNGREDESRVTASISFLQLPASDASFFGHPQKELRIWTHTMGDVNIIDFTMDPSQDLLVLVALASPESKYVYELHIRSIQTNLPHHKASVPILSCWLKPSAPIQSNDLVAGVRVQVVGNLVALLIKEIQEGTAAHLEIWNWETNPQYSCALTRHSGIDDFTFLTHDTFLVVRPTGRFEVYTFANPSQGSTKPECRVAYSFPPLSPGYMYWYMSMSSNPAPGYIPRHRKHIPELGHNRQLYYPRPEERIHACCVYIFNPASEENAHVHSFVFFLNLQTLLNPLTEWIDKTQAMQASKSKPSKRSRERSDDPNIPNSSPIASSSSSPIPGEISINDAPPQIYLEDQDDEPPFIPPSSYLTAEDDDDRHSPPYPLFPTFDEHRPPNVDVQSRRLHRHNSLKHSTVKPTPDDSSHRTRPATSSLTSIPSKTEIPWEVWGPESTRWFEECLSTDWQHAIYGLRTVESVNLDHRQSARPVPGNTDPDAPIDKSNAFVDISITDDTNGSGEDIPLSPLTESSMSGSSTLQASQSTSTESSTLPENGEGGEPPADAQGDGQDDDDDDEHDNPARRRRRHLRVRDFNSYSFTKSTNGLSSIQTNPVRPSGISWHEPHLVTGSTTTHVKGVFTKDIVSSLPYMEIVSRETFEVTDVMMDDCRLLLLKRGRAGKLKRVEVLMM